MNMHTKIHEKCRSDLAQMTTPEEAAGVISVCYPDPLDEVARREKACAEDGPPNRKFWAEVRCIMLATLDLAKTSA